MPARRYRIVSTAGNSVATKKQPAPAYEVLAPGRDQIRVIVVAAEDCKVLRITTSRGHQIDVELWERTPGQLEIRGISGSLVIRPHSSNVVHVSVDR